MGVLATDILIKSFLEFAINDLRANQWLLPDVFGDLANDPMTRAEYGYKEVKAAIDWFTSTKVEVLLQHRVADKPVLPCYSIAYNASPEREDRASMADEGPIEQVDTGRVIKVYSNFTPKSYDPNTGKMVFPKGITSDVLSAGQFVVSTTTGTAYVINKVKDSVTFYLDKDIQEDFTNCYVAPSSSLYNVHREIAFQNETFTIGCHAENIPSQCQWMWQILVYSIGRYREAFLEGRGFELSTYRSTALERNTEFQGQNVYSRYVDLSGTTEVSWIKFRALRFDNVKMDITIASGPSEPPDQIYETDDPAWRMVNDPIVEED